MDDNKTFSLPDKASIDTFIRYIVGDDPKDRGYSPWTLQYRRYFYLLLAAICNQEIVNFGDDCHLVGDIVNSNINKIIIRRTDFLQWIEKNNIKLNLFNSDDEEYSEKVKPEYADKVSDYYAPKLAMALDAWTAVRALGNTDQIKQKHSSVKKALLKWLKDNAHRYSAQSDVDNDESRESVATIANWDSKGGRPPTKGKKD